MSAPRLIDAGALLQARITGWREEYVNTRACLAWLLCDRHPPNAVALTVVSPTLQSTPYTYAELRDGSERLAGILLQLGVGRGDRVATLLGKGAEVVIATLAVWRIGAVHVPLFTAFAPAAVAYRVSHSGARVVITDRTNRPKLEPCADVPSGVQAAVIRVGGTGAGDIDFWQAVNNWHGERPAAAALGGGAPFILLYTSGTTGHPKGVTVPIAALAAFEAYMRFGLDVRPRDVFWNAADPGWAYGLYYAVIGPLLLGQSTLLLAAPFTPQLTYDVLRTCGVTNFAAAPTVYRSLRAFPGAPASGTLGLRALSSAGEPLGAELNDWAVEQLGTAIHDHYGQTELGMVLNNHHDPALAVAPQPGSMGIEMPGFRVLVLEEAADRESEDNRRGRLAIEVGASPLFWFGGYHNAPEQTAERYAGDGRYYVTGDAAVRDSQGRFTFLGRADDLIIMAGYRIGPLEIESVLLSHPAVAEAAVAGVPDAILGESIHAFVVLRGGTAASEAIAMELQQLVKSRYAAHAYPRAVHFVETLPRTPSGKVQRFLLRRQPLPAPRSSPPAAGGATVR